MFCLLFLSAICSSWGLECYTSFDKRNNLCSADNQHLNVYQTAEDCCDSSNAVAYSESRPENGTIDCTSCKQIRKATNVFCYQTLSKDQRVCRNLHSLMASSVEECCAYRGALNNLTGGFNFHKLKQNSTKQTYECIPCKEAIIPATEWTAWTQCNSSCGGGYKQRKNMCKQDTFYPPYAICVGLKTETLNCNEHLCPENRPIAKSIIALIVAIVLLVLFLIGILIWHLCKMCTAARSKLSKYNFGVKYKSSIDMTTIGTGTSRYETGPRKRELPSIPTETATKIGIDFHTYADIQSNECYDNSGYLPMSGKVECYSNVTN